jgi:general secretion pathway protein M
MNTRSLTMPPALATLRQQAMQHWRGLAARERRGLTLALVALGLFALWSTLVQPAWRTLREAPAQLDQLETQLQQMQRVAAESRSLRGAAPVTLAQAALALKSATDRLGDKGKITQQGERATLTLNGVSPEALRAWMNEVRSAARARPVEAQLVRGAAGYNGTLVVNLASAS